MPTPAVGEGEEYVLTGNAARVYDIDKDAKIVAWRVECFEAMGLSALVSQALAVRRDIDRVDVERMVKAGTPAATILRIYAHD